MSSPTETRPPRRPRRTGQPVVKRRRGLDERQLRFERGLAAVILLSGYVWNRDLMIALVAVVVTATMVTTWSLRPFGIPFEAVIAPRLAHSGTLMPRGAVRTDDLVVSAALLITTLLMFIGFTEFARLSALIIAGALMLEAAAGVWVSAPLAKRLHR